MASHQTIQRIAKRFQSLKSMQDLSAVLQIPSSKIVLNSLHPRYKVFTIFKSNGKKRTIEDPVPPLKKILRKLNEQLQACYYTIRPKAVHGFCISNDGGEDRNIISNASSHIGKFWLLNIDFRDFFHTVLDERVKGIWAKHFAKLDKESLETLIRLTCFNYRLPMGSPTSPVLSNYAALQLDEELEVFCRNCGITYTRFADDCSFSSHQEIDHKTIRIIRDTITAQRFLINEEKVKLYTPGDTKMVTGIVVGTTGLRLSDLYMERLSDEINRLHTTRCVEQRYQTGMSLKKLELFEQELRGKLNFAKMVEGNTSKLDELNLRFENALYLPDDFESGNWLEIPYNFF